ncbi:ubiquitin carboxyl-terminal hydrolase MINDY-1-like [Hippocampus comes]|uniref:ubiquitin carboxyl-terminal hydrolase MINDY-1-like n=1 Tax=Hippocampus comes TaxID=109280 RepID=UPI00094EB244|nr:PREDICTED: ubiquitin carboxyl-terminal hydrolase MINDY-1-like [Hippocampus comes]
MSASNQASSEDTSCPPTDTAKECLGNTATVRTEAMGQLTSDQNDRPPADQEDGAEPTLSENGPTRDDAGEDLPGVVVTGAGPEAVESLSVATADSSDELRESSDSASFSLPSLDLSEGMPAAAAGSLQEPDDVLSSSYSALGVEGCSPANEVASLKDDEVAGGAAPAEAAAGTSAAYYLVKWITWKKKKTPIITQSDNGPCPLLAIMNILFLRWKAKLPAQTEVVTTEDLMAHLGECVLSVTPRQKTDGMELNFQQNMSDAMAVLPKLSTGLDVNVRFSAVTDFEYTPECIVFDLLDIPLYHGWLVDPQSPEMVAAVGKLSYNQLVEKIIDYKHSADSTQVAEGLVAEHFLETTATQLSYHGLCELNAAAKEGEMCVFFRNNHFSTMIKHKGHLYLLVTDQGFLREEGLVWESLHNVEGDGNFLDHLEKEEDPHYHSK